MSCYLSPVFMYWDYYYWFKCVQSFQMNFTFDVMVNDSNYIVSLHQAEFMEHDEKPLPIDIRTLGQLAEKVGLVSVRSAEGSTVHVW